MVHRARGPAFTAAVVLCLVAGACSTDLGGAKSSAPSPTSPPMPEPVPIGDLAPVEITIQGDPDPLIVGFGSIWVMNDSGTVTRIDPTTAAIVAEIKVHGLDPEGCNSLGLGNASIWSCKEGDLVRIDPATNVAEPPIHADKVWSQIRLVQAEGRIWVLTGDGTSLIGLDESSGESSDPIALPVPCTDLASAASRLYVVCEEAGRVLGVDLTSGTITADLSVPKPHHVSASATDVWVEAGMGVLQLDPMTLDPRRTYPGIRVGLFGALRADDAGVWIRRIDPFLTRIDAASGAITAVVTAPFEEGGDVVVDGDHLWASTLHDSVVVRLEVPAGS